MELSIKVPVSPKLLSDILSTAIEGGINYWLRNLRVTKDKAGEIEAIDVKPDEQDAEFIHIDYTKMVEAMQKIFEGQIKVNPQISQSIYTGVTENDAGCIDADGADVIVQAAAFNDIVYG